MAARKKKVEDPAEDPKVIEGRKARQQALGTLAHTMMKDVGSGRLVIIYLRDGLHVEGQIARVDRDVLHSDQAIDRSNLSFTLTDGTRIELNDVKSVL